MCMHRSASGLGVQNEGCEFESFESLLHIVLIKHFHSLFIHLSTETDSTIEDFHYWTTEVIFKPYFESENIMKMKIKWKYQRMTTFFTKQHATKERIEKDWNDYQNGKWIQLHRCPFWTPKLNVICSCAWIYHWTKKLWKIRTGPLCLQATETLGCLAVPFCRPLGCCELLGCGSAFSKTWQIYCCVWDQPKKNRNLGSENSM